MEKIKTVHNIFYWKECGCEASEEETECRYCSRTHRCDSCGWIGAYPKVIDGEVFGAILLCPVCNSDEVEVEEWKN